MDELCDLLDLLDLADLAEVGETVDVVDPQILDVAELREMTEYTKWRKRGPVRNSGTKNALEPKGEVCCTSGYRSKKVKSALFDS